MNPDSAIQAKCFHLTGTFIEFTKEEIEQSIPKRFEKQVAKYPDRSAVKSRKHHFTYDELNKASNRVAQAILSRRGAGQEPVALLMEHDAPVIAAILGVLKVGAIYVPLDPSLPHSRAKYILENSQASHIVTNTNNLSLAKSLAGTADQLINIDKLEDLSGENPCIDVKPDDLSWIIYTSGSTGNPKGVIHVHRNVLHFIMNHTNGLHISPHDRLTLLYSFSVNGGAHDIFSALLNGATLYPYDLKEEGFTHLSSWLIQEKITIYHSVPTVFRHFLQNLTRGEEFRDLRIIRLGGEPVYRHDVESYKKHFDKDCIFVNRLGSSETGSIRWTFMDKATQIKGNLAPVGYPVMDNEILLLDDEGKEAVGNEGEIAVKTRYLSPGYWRGSDLTDAVFLPDPSGGDERIYRTGDMGRMLPDGCLLHLGRKDFQVKIRGYRIEVDEIEMALVESPALKEAVVVAREDNLGDVRLVAYCVPSGKTTPNTGELRSFLKEKLPDYMIPSAFVMLDVIPLTATRKVDRKALPTPSNSRPELNAPYVAPRTPIEEELAKTWAEVLGLDQVGIHDDFFELGGHSLAATQIISRIIKDFQLELPLKSLFESPTVADMAMIILQNEGRKVGEKELASVLAELESLSDEEAKRHLTDESK